MVLTGGNVNDCTIFTQVMAAVKFRRPGPGRPPTRPSRILADKGYSSRAIRSYLRQRHIPAAIPERRDQQANRLRRGRAGGRPPAFDQVATSYRSMIDLATLLIWL
ncbi:hypothetical protein FHX82_006996 [Amycolatopsis bartoniae]|uniref:IS5 family transposase n=1 Tax=Amycolatopsis bartoniae TaxID=941986 RepID=A0A8H9ITC7_9PSEU|nr:hypothetical protein [Amycolatopsis bartoniae]GHF35731.1 IS5 family transposase [Amycolatopsis bartoniae]